MTSEINRKKHHTTRELLTGGGIFLLTLPFVATALLMVVFAVFVGIGMLLFGSDGQSSAYLFLLLVYGSALAMLVYSSWRVVRRSVFLINRLRGIRREKQRIAPLTERETSRLTIADTDETASIEPAKQQEQQRYQ